MERLTEKKEADAQRRAYEKRLEQGYPRNVPEERFLRLAAYEDTGLEPEEIITGEELTETACALNKLKQYQALGTVDELSALVKARDEGRLPELPCKVGDTVYSLFCNEVIEKRIGRLIINSYTNPALWVELDCDFLSSATERWDVGLGTKFFLTRAEAEAAKAGDCYLRQNLKWISAREQLPKAENSVLIIVSGSPCSNIELIDAYEFGNYSDEEGWIVEAYPEWEHATVTHWMPLPEPPND